MELGVGRAIGFDELGAEFVRFPDGVIVVAVDVDVYTDETCVGGTGTQAVHGRTPHDTDVDDGDGLGVEANGGVLGDVFEPFALGGVDGSTMNTDVELFSRERTHYGFLPIAKVVSG